VKEITLIFVIVILMALVVVLAVAVFYLCRILFRVEERLSDLQLEVHFATNHYLIDERKKQRESESGSSGND
jgi:predicted Holliday junction resolvase-like endonuclease